MPKDSTSQEVEDKEDILPVLPKNDVVATGAMRQEIPDSEDVGSEEGSIKDFETPNDRSTENQSCHPSPLPDSLGSPESEGVKFAKVPSNEKEENINDTGDGGDVQEKHERVDYAPPLDINETEQVDKPAQGIEGINDEKVDVVTSKPINAPTASEQQVSEHNSQPSVDHGVEGDLTAAAQDTEHVLPSSGPTLSNICTEKSIPDSDDSGSVSSASDHDVEEKAFSESYKGSKVASLDAKLPSTDNWHSVRAEDRAGDDTADEPKAIVDQNTISRDIINNVATAKETSEETGLSMNAQQSAIMREQDGEMPSESQESAEYSRGSLVRSSAAEASKQHIAEKTEETNELETTQERQINSCTTATIQSSSDETLDASGAEAVLEKTSIQDGEILSSTDNSAQDGVTVQIARSTPLIEVSSSSPHHEPALEQDEEVDMIDTPTSSPPILYESTSNRQDPCADEEDTPMSDISTAPVPTTERSKMPSQDAETDEDSGKNKPPNPPPVIPEPKTTKKDKDKNVKMSDVSAKLSQPVAKAGEKRSLSRSASASASPQPNKDVLLTELKNIKIASIQARNAALQAEIDAKRAKLEEMKRELKYPAAETVKNHIKLLHDYNDIRDVGQGLVGMIADNRGVRIGELYDEFGVGLQD